MANFCVYSTVTKTCDLGKDEPDPVTGLSPGPQLIEDCVIEALLRGEKALEIVIVSHGLCPRRTSSAKIPLIVRNAYVTAFPDEPVLEPYRRMHLVR